MAKSEIDLACTEVLNAITLYKAGGSTVSDLFEVVLRLFNALLGAPCKPEGPANEKVSKGGKVIGKT